MKLIYENYESEKCKKVCNIFEIKGKIRILNIDIPSSVIENQIILITGMSGSGKTTLANELANRNGFIKIDEKFDHEKTIIDIIEDSLKNVVSILNALGLGEPFLYITPYKYLSTGQKFRFCLAYSMSKGVSNIYIDEFCSYLDRDTAKFIAYSFGKLVRKNGMKCILATAHSDLSNYVNPNLEIKISLDSKPKLIYLNHSGVFPFEDDLSVVCGSYADYKKLEMFHYFDSSSEEDILMYAPKYFSLFLRDNLIGVLVLRAPYTNIQVDDEFIEINKSIYIVHRIIIHPIARGVGITKKFFSKVKYMANKRNFFVASALAVYFPYFIESMGFNKIPKNNYNASKEYLIMKEYYEKNIFIEKEELLKVMIKIYAKYMFWYYSQYNNLLKRNLKYTESDFFNFIISSEIITIDDIDDLYYKLKFFDMEYFTYSY